MIKSLSTSILCFSLVLNSFGQTGFDNSHNTGYSPGKVLDEKGYFIAVPSNWKLDRSGQMGTSFIVFSPLSGEKDQFKENVNLIIHNLQGQKIDLDKYVEISLGQIRMRSPNGVLLENKRLKSNNSDFRRVTYTNSQNGLNFKIEQYYFVTNTNAYILSFTCESDQFEKYVATGEQILNSFRLK